MSKIFGDTRRRGANSHAIETEAGDTRRSRNRIDTGLMEGVIDNAKFPRQTI
jgi:hypothetical protein